MGNSRLSDEEFEKIKCEASNEEVGDLKGYDCPKCKNKGYYFDIINKKATLIVCECMNTRKSLSKLKESGITQDMFNKYSFESYKAEEDYQKIILSKAKDFLKNINEGNNYWLYFGGISGIGKTHICTAILKEFLKKDYSCKYFLWKNELSKLKILKKSFIESQQSEYREKFNELLETDILYIDDFLKLLDTRSNEDLDIAYEIINGRYLNNKITIISSELDKAELGEIDLAICGRICEKTTKEFFIQPKKDLHRNYRLKY